MDPFGWGDPIDSPIQLAYCRKGERREHGFSGPVGVLGEGRTTVSWLRRSELPLREGRLDLSRVPVVGIGGKRKAQPSQVREFLTQNPGFEGVFLLYPGTGNWDLGEGMIFVTSREVLSGRPVSGGRPEVQLANHRWLHDGRWVADRVRSLHGKVLDTLEAELEQEPGAERIAAALTGWSCPFAHPLHEVCRRVIDELAALEQRRVMLSGEQTRDMTALVRERLAEKLRDVWFVRNIPAGFLFSASEVAPELVVQAETLGPSRFRAWGGVAWLVVSDSSSAVVPSWRYRLRSLCR